MRLHISLEDERHWEEIEASLGALASEGHEWDRDPAAWVHAGRHADARWLLEACDPERLGSRDGRQ